MYLVITTIKESGMLDKNRNGTVRLCSERDV